MTMKLTCDGLILDVDGTLWDSTEVVAKAWQKAIDQLSMKSNIDCSAENLKQHFGKTMEVIAENIFPEESKERQLEMMKLCCQIENQDLLDCPKDLLYPGVKDTIHALAAKMPLFIVSNCQAGYIEILIEKYGLQEDITDIECYGNNGHEKDYNIRLLAERNGLKEPIYVGDTQGDQDACKKAGLPMIWAAYGFGSSDSHIAEIRQFSDLLGLLS